MSLQATIEISEQIGNAPPYDHEARAVRDEQVPPTDYATRNRAVTDNFIKAIDGDATPYLTLQDMLCNTEFAVTLADVR